MLMQQMIEFNALNYPDSIALQAGTQTLNYAEFDRRCNQLANGLKANGLQHGDRVAMLAKNNPDYPALIVACMKAEVTLVPLNYRLAPQELKFILQDCDASMLVVGDAELRAAAEASSATESIRHCFSLDGEHPGWQDFNTLLNVSDERPHHSGRMDSVVFQLYTSGTTGQPKGVMIGHEQLTNGYVMGNHIPPRCQIGHTGVMPLPLFHVAGLAAALFWLCNGYRVQLLADFIPQEVVNAIVASDSCDAVLVPAMIQAILAFVPDIQNYDFSPLQRITYGASPISIEVLQQAIGIFKCDFVQGYGMTELSCMVLGLQARDHQRALAGESHLLRSCGRPLPGAELKVVDDQGEEVAQGETGELLIRSSTAMMGYWNQPDKTAETLVNGWLYTGDAGYVDAEGFFYIRDRVKDMIVSGGENIYPAEIENVLFSHPSIQDVAVIAVPDDKFGEAALAVCVLKPDTQVSSDDLIAFCREHLASYKTPRRYDFVEEIPRNPSGKILKRVIREPYWQSSERQVG